MSTRPTRPAHVALRRGLIALVAGALLGAGPSVAAEAFPSKPVTLLVPYAAGGITDSLARIVGRKLGERWGQQVLVDNKPGAGTVIGTAQAARAPGDGYTLLLTSFGYVANQVMLPSLPYPVAALEPLALLGDAPGVLYVHPSVPASTVPEFVRHLRERRPPAAFASSGNGSSVHVMAELFAAAIGVEILHVPYKGNAPALADLIGGQVQAMFDSPANLGQVRAGRLRALGVTSPGRSALTPELTPIAEAGEPALASFQAGSWFGFFVPATTPKELQARLHADIQAVMALPGMREDLLKAGIESRPMSQAAFADYLRQQLATWGPVIRAKNIKPD
jgi:tripartite-type tricarboxylate transporter receptor subunit TctC